MTLTQYIVTLRWWSGSKWQVRRFDSFKKAVDEAERLGLTQCIIKAQAIYEKTVDK